MLVIGLSVYQPKEDPRVRPQDLKTGRLDPAPETVPPQLRNAEDSVQHLFPKLEGEDEAGRRGAIEELWSALDDGRSVELAPQTRERHGHPEARRGRSPPHVRLAQGQGDPLHLLKQDLGPAALRACAVELQNLGKPELMGPVLSRLDERGLLAEPTPRRPSVPNGTAPIGAEASEAESAQPTP